MASLTRQEIIARHDKNSGTRTKSFRLYEEDINFILNESKSQGVRISDFIHDLLQGGEK